VAAQTFENTAVPPKDRAEADLPVEPEDDGGGGPGAIEGGPGAIMRTATSRLALLSWALLIFQIALTGAFLWLWFHPPVPASLAADDTALTQRIGALEARLAQLDQRPAPPRPIDVGPLLNRLAALEQRAASDPAQAERLNVLGARADSLDARLTGLEQATARAIVIAERADRRGRLQLAMTALAAGQPLGTLPGAPPAAAKFAAIAPPTEASLRRGYEAAERAALEAGGSGGDGASILDRTWARAQSLITIRQGDRVLVGNPAAETLARTRAALDKGDLAAAVSMAATLSGEPAKAVAPWLEDARSVLAARAALAEMAEKP
jgi:hypothetical protein